MLSRRHLFQRFAGAAAIATTARPVRADRALVALESASSASSSPIRLNRNENAYGPSPKAFAVLQRASDAAARYPDLAAAALRFHLAALHSVKPEEVVLGCGSGEVMRMAVDAFVGSRKRLVTALPSYALPADRARRAGGEVASIRLTPDYAHDLHGMLAATREAAGLVYICNPNNPTGTLTPRADLEAFIRALPPTTYVLIDEAYHHYVRESSGYASLIDRRIDDQRVIVVRTFSTAYGLAGLRVGYAVAAPETARALAAHSLADNVNAVAARTAIAALDDAGYLRAVIQRNADDRQEFYNQANARMIKGIDSHANFVMINTGMPAGATVERLSKYGVLVPGPFPQLDSYVRVSLGSQADMRAFWRAWDRVVASPMTM